MIRDFWVENYLSIRDRQCLDFTAKGPETEYVAEVSKGIFVYKLAVLFGANASGKSNILLALDKLFDILQKPKTAN
jgi:AAA15 family ATPase/GTPase